MQPSLVYEFIVIALKDEQRHARLVPCAAAECAKGRSTATTPAGATAGPPATPIQYLFSAASDLTVDRSCRCTTPGHACLSALVLSTWSHAHRHAAGEAAADGRSQHVDAAATGSAAVPTTAAAAAVAFRTAIHEQNRKSTHVIDDTAWHGELPHAA
jgi:hypothetical protein